MIDQSTILKKKSLFDNFIVLILSLAIIFASIVTSQVASAATGSIGGRPAYPRADNKRTKSIFVHKIDLGNSVDDGLLVINNSDTTQTVNIYAVDASVTSSGSLTCRQRVEEKKDIGGWVSLAKSSVTLEAGKDETVPFTVVVPSEGVDVGEHNGCIVIEPVVDETNDADSSGVKIRTRSAIRLAVTIPGELKKSLDFVNFATRFDKGNLNYDLSVKNNGNVSLDTTIKVRLSSLIDATVYSNSGQYPVVPKTQLDLTFTHEKLPMFGGWYWVDASVKYDSSTKNSIGERNNQEIVTKNWPRQLIFISPSASGLLIMIVIALAAISLPVYFIRRSRIRRRILSGGLNHVVNQGETIQSISTHYKVAWKKLVVINKIKPPYELTVGSTIVIPQKAPRKKTKKTKKPE